MPAYEIEQYELHAMKYRVEAASQAEAEPVCQSQDFIEIAEDYGLPADEHHELAEELRGMNVAVNELIPSIRSIEEV